MSIAVQLRAQPATTHAIRPLLAAIVWAKFNEGSTAWVLIGAALVMLMLPGLALFYGGMVRRKNVLATMMHSFAALAVVGVEWIVIGYAMAFGRDHWGVIGFSPGDILLWSMRPGTAVNPSGHAVIPAYAFVMFQGMFAIITPALIAGAFAERIKFSAYLLFTLLWSLLVYNPLAHWVWGGGWLGASGLGALDFAGGTVVHISAGASALVMAFFIGKRVGYPTNVLQPNSLVLTLLGAGLLWFGWFGFNAGSAGVANGSAALAFTTTQIAAAAGALAWLVAEWIKHGRPTSLGLASGLVAGLVAITPASGFVSPAAAMVIGGAAGVVCYGAVLVKSRMGYDDSLDAFGVHGVGGFLGALLTGVFAEKAFGGADGLLGGRPYQLVVQLIAACSAMAYAMIATFILAIIVDKLVGLRVSEIIEIEGLDPGIHAEHGWDSEHLPAPSVEMPGSQVVERRPIASMVVGDGARI